MNDPSRTQSAASRYLIVLILGLLIGVVATVMAMRAIQARQDHFPDSLMQVMARQSQMLNESLKQNRCTVNDSTPRLQSLRALSNDLELAFPSLRDDARFQQHASEFRAALDKALTAPPTDCETLKAVTGQVAGGCKACHQDFR